MLRQKRHITLTYAAAAADHLIDNASKKEPGGLVVRVHHKRLTAEWAPYDTSEYVPSFRGKCQIDGDSLVVSGTIREKPIRAVVIVAYVVGILIGVTFVVLSREREDNHVVLMVMGIVLIIAFACVLAVALILRRSTFRDQAGELESGLHTYLKTGSAHRDPD